MAALDKLRTAGPEAVGQLCSLIEFGSDWLGGELPDGRASSSRPARLRHRSALHQTQCRVSQGNLDRELMTQLGFLKSELVRCNDTI